MVLISVPGQVFGFVIRYNDQDTSLNTMKQCLDSRQVQNIFSVLNILGHFWVPTQPSVRWVTVAVLAGQREGTLS
jgi:hypothetical protein